MYMLLVYIRDSLAILSQQIYNSKKKEQSSTSLIIHVQNFFVRVLTFCSNYAGLCC